MNYLRITMRDLWQHKLHTFINAIGLAAGLACMLPAVLFMPDEQRFDKFHLHQSAVYHINTTLVADAGALLAPAARGMCSDPLFILSVAVINLVYITNAGGLKRPEEVGPAQAQRRQPGQIILRFLPGSAIVCIISFIPGGVFTLIASPVFNELQANICN